MRQQTFTDIEYANRKRSTKREEFLKSMDQIIPWGGLDSHNQTVLSVGEARTAGARYRDYAADVSDAVLVQSIR